MKTYHLWLILFIFSGFSVFAAKKPDAKSVYLQDLTSVNVVESLTDFQSVQKGKVYVKMLHNAENVKVQIVAPDESMQTKFLMQGLKVFVDISGKKSKKYIIQFPKFEREQMRGNVQQQREPGQQNGQQGRMNVEQMLEMVNANNAELINGRNKTTLDTEKANIQKSKDNLVFTITLPLSLLGDKIGKDNIVSVGFLAEMESQPTEGMGAGGSGGMRGGGGSGGGGMRGGGGGGMRGGGGPMGGDRGGSAFSEMATPFYAWVEFGLSGN